MNTQQEEKIKPISTALIGFGLSGSVFQFPFLSTMPQFKLLQVASRSASSDKRLRGIEVIDDYQAPLKNPKVELVFISAPNQFHYSLAKQALENGKHVVVEKPVTVTVQEALELKQIARAKGKVLAVYHNRRFDGDFLSLKNIIRRERLGKIHNFHSYFNRFAPIKNHWRESSQKGSGVLYDLGPHLIDQAFELFGAPDSLFADLKIQRKGAQNTDYFHLQLRYNNGPQVHLQAGCQFADHRTRYIAHGDRASLIKYQLDSQEPCLKRGLAPQDLGFGLAPENEFFELTNSDGKREKFAPGPGQYTVLFKQYYSAIREGSQDFPGIDAGINTLRLIELAHHSHYRGQWLTYN
jgi:scyllo-inositol 2-dehydrogenase (NADP+)